MIIRLRDTKQSLENFHFVFIIDDSGTMSEL